MTNWHNVRRHFRLFASCAINAVPPNYEPGETESPILFRVWVKILEFHTGIWVENCQLALVWLALRSCSHAAISSTIVPVNHGCAGLQRLNDPVVAPAFPGFGKSAFNSIRAFSKRCTALLPLLISVSSCSRSSPLSRTTYFFTEISLAAVILSVACLATESHHEINVLAN